MGRKCAKNRCNTPVTGKQRKRRKLATNDRNVQANESTEHPLKISVVLHIIFGFLSEKDLRSCRQVHTTWTPEADSYLKHCCKYIDLRFYSTRHILKFVKVVESSTDFPFNKIELPYDVDQCVRDELLLCLATRLKGLKLAADPKMSDFPEYLIFPDLTELHFSEDLDAEECNFVPSFLEKYSSQLNSLSSSEVRTETLLTIASNSFLQLTKLQLRHCKLPEIGMVHQIVGNHKDTLIDLELELCPQCWFRPVYCPKLKYLKLLNISVVGKYIGGGDDNPFPALHTLYFVPAGGQILTPTPLMNLLNGQPANKLDLLVLAVFDTAYHPDMTKAVSQLFPNVRRLLINAFSPTNILRLLEPLNKLTELRLYLLENNEKNEVENMTAKITGLPMNDINRWKEWSENEFAEMERQCDRMYKELAPYTVLQRIKNFTLHYPELTSKKMMNTLELPCRLVFLQMPKLTRLTIAHYTGYERKRRTLSERMQLVQERMQQKFEVTWQQVIRPTYNSGLDILY